MRRRFGWIQRRAAPGVAQGRSDDGLLWLWLSWHCVCELCRLMNTTTYSACYFFRAKGKLRYFPSILGSLSSVDSRLLLIVGYQQLRLHTCGKLLKNVQFIGCALRNVLRYDSAVSIFIWLASSTGWEELLPEWTEQIILLHNLLMLCPIVCAAVILYNEEVYRSQENC